MKLLFLDIDGVITSDEAILDMTRVYPFSDACVAVLNKVLEQHKLRIILTSSWRTVFDAEKQNQVFKENGVNQVPAGQTKEIAYSDRGKEIAEYLAKRKVDCFVILDDMYMDGFENNFVHIDPKTGLTEAYLERINEILK